MKVYIVFDYFWFDEPALLGIFSTKEKAEEFIKNYETTESHKTFLKVEEKEVE